MLNSTEVYRDCGRRVAQARNQRDEARAEFTKRWFTNAKNMEKPEAKVLAQAAFDEGYAEARVVPAVKSI